MSRLLITPKNGMEPYTVEGKLTRKYWLGLGWVYYIGGGSYPEDIVTKIEYDEDEGGKSE